MQINVTFDQSTSSLPTGFVAAIDYVVNYYDTLFTNNVTINLDVGYGEIDGQPMESGALGESEAANYVAESYNSVENALVAEGAPGALTLPSTSPLSGTLYMSQAEAQALGLTNAVSTNYVGFSSVYPFSYTANVTPASNEYYFIGVAEHEISEDMGRVSLLNYQPYDYSPIDLFRYTSSGVRDTSTGGNGSTAYFSINNGATNLGTWNNNPNNGDLADWYPSGPAPGGYDAYNDYTNSGVLTEVSPDDITLMEALGWDTQPAEPDLIAYLNNSALTAAAGSDISLQVWTDNFGNGASGSSTTALFLSSTPTITTSDTLLGTISVGVLGAENNGSSWYNEQTVSVALSSSLTPGTYYVGGFADYNGSIVETNNNDNTVQLTVTAPAQPDLIAYLNNSALTAAAGSDISLQVWTDNFGNGASGSSTTALFLSSTPTITTSDTLLGTISVGVLGAENNGSSWYNEQTVSVALSSSLTPGTYYVGGFADYNGSIVETNNNDNTVQLTVTAPAQPDLIAYLNNSALTAAAGSDISLQVWTDNFGNGASGSSTTALFLSSTPTITTSDTLLGTISVGVLGAENNGSSWYNEQTVSVALSSSLTPGTYYVGGFADYNGSIVETNNNDNTVQLTVTAPAQPDLIAYLNNSALTAAAGSDISLQVWTDNFGNGASGSSTTALFLSSTPTITTSDTLLGTISVGVLGAENNGSSWYNEQTVSVALSSSLTPGTYYVGGFADYNGSIVETNNNDNTVQLTVTAPAQPASTLTTASEGNLQTANAATGADESSRIGPSATLVLAAANSGSVTFQGSTGMLQLDEPSTFTGEIFGFTGNGTLSGSDQIDLTNIAYTSVTDSYSGGVLHVSDGKGDSDSLNFNGSYSLANFEFASDGSGGTIVYDPPVPGANSPSPGQAAAANSCPGGQPMPDRGQFANGVGAPWTVHDDWHGPSGAPSNNTLALNAQPNQHPHG